MNHKKEHISYAAPKRPRAGRVAQWTLYFSAAAYATISGGVAYAQPHGKNAKVNEDLRKSSLSEKKNESSYREGLRKPLDTSIPEGTFKCVDMRHRLPNGVTVHNVGVTHLHDFFAQHREKILGAVKDSQALTAELGMFFDYCETYAKERGVQVFDLNESRKRARAAGWGDEALVINILVAAAAAMALIVNAGAGGPKTDPKRVADISKLLEGLPDIQKAYASWKREREQAADFRAQNPLPKKSREEHLEEVWDVLKEMSKRFFVPGHRTTTWVAGGALAVMIGAHAWVTRDVMDLTGSQTFDPGSPALSRFADSITADFDCPEGVAPTPENSSVTYDSRTMYEHAKKAALSMEPGSTLLLLTGNRHASDFETWFAQDNLPATPGNDRP